MKRARKSEAFRIGFEMGGTSGRGYVPNFFARGTKTAKDFSDGVAAKIRKTERLKA